MNKMDVFVPDKEYYEYMDMYSNSGGYMHGMSFLLALGAWSPRVAPPTCEYYEYMDMYSTALGVWSVCNLEWPGLRDYKDMRLVNLLLSNLSGSYNP